MPAQQLGLNITVSGGYASVTMRGSEYQIPLGQFEDRSLDFDQVLTNMRLTYLIGGYAEFNSIEYLNAVNKLTNGMELKIGRRFITSVLPQGGGYYSVFLGKTLTSPDFEIGVSASRLTEDAGDPLVLVPNVATWLRIEKYNTLTPAALNKLKTANFWY